MRPLLPASTLALAMMAASQPCAQAQTRPLLTEEAGTGPQGRLSLEAGIESMVAEPNLLTGEARDVWQAPVLHLTYSPAANVELDLEWVARVIAVNDATFGSVSDWGDVALRTKIRILDAGPDRPALSARFGVTLPNTKVIYGLGPDALRMTAQVLASRALGRVCVDANAGLAIHDEALRPHEQVDFFAYGLAVRYRLRPRLALVGELAGLAGHGEPGTEAHGEARAGVRFGTGRVRGDAALRIGLAEADGSWGLSLGLTWSLRPGRS